MSDSLLPHGLYSPWNSPGQNTGVGSLALLQGIFLTQELNRGLLRRRQIFYHLSFELPEDTGKVCEWDGRPLRGLSAPPLPPMSLSPNSVGPHLGPPVLDRQMVSGHPPPRAQRPHRHGAA